MCVQLYSILFVCIITYLLTHKTTRCSRITWFHYFPGKKKSTCTTTEETSTTSVRARLLLSASCVFLFIWLLALLFISYAHLTNELFARVYIIDLQATVTDTPVHSLLQSLRPSVATLYIPTRATDSNSSTHLLNALNPLPVRSESSILMCTHCLKD